MRNEITETRVGKNRYRGYELRRIGWGTSVTYRGTSRDGIDFTRPVLFDGEVDMQRDFDTVEDLKREIKNWRGE